MPVHTSTLADVRRRMTQRRSARHHRLNLERELAAYTTAAERAELEALLEGQSDSVDAEVARILLRQRIRALHNPNDLL